MVWYFSFIIFAVCLVIFGLYLKENISEKAWMYVLLTGCLVGAVISFVIIRTVLGSFGL